MVLNPFGAKILIYFNALHSSAAFAVKYWKWFKYTLFYKSSFIRTLDYNSSKDYTTSMIFTEYQKCCITNSILRFVWALSQFKSCQLKVSVNVSKQSFPYKVLKIYGFVLGLRLYDIWFTLWMILSNSSPIPMNKKLEYKENVEKDL